MKRRFILLLSFVCVFFCVLQHDLYAQSSTFFSNVEVFDGEQKTESTNVLVVDGKIKAIGPNVAAADGSKKIDGTGKTLMPGMIDSHTHVWMVTDLQQAAMFGVTTELDMMGSYHVGAAFRKQQTDGEANDRADYFSAGAAVTVKDGHGTQFGIPVPTLGRVEDTDQFVNDRVREGSDYIKLIYEDGSPYGRTLPTISEAMFGAAVKAAHRNEKLAVAHISSQAGAKMAFENGIDGLVHLFADKPIDAAVVELAKSKDVFVAPTASIISNTLGESPLAQLLTDENLLPMLDNATMASLARTYPPQFASKENWQDFKNSIKALHEAGVPILAGTDSPNPGTTHGVSMHMEIRLLVDAGLSPTDSLAAATSLPAKHFGLDDRGRIATGLRADLILVEGDPTKDITAVANIVGVWKAGHAIDRQTQMDIVTAEAKAAENREMATENKMVSDFDTETDTAKPKSSFGAGWSVSTDSIMGGNSTAEIKIVDSGAAGSKSCLEVSGKTRAQQPAFSGVMFTPGKFPMSPGDISAHQGISFWAKGNGEKAQLMFFSQKRGMMPSTKAFVADKEWKQYEFQISDFDGCDGTDVLGIWFGRNSPGEFQFQIDQVELVK